VGGLAARATSVASGLLHCMRLLSLAGSAAVAAGGRPWCRSIAVIRRLARYRAAHGGDLRRWTSYAAVCELHASVSALASHSSSLEDVCARWRESLCLHRS